MRSNKLHKAGLTAVINSHDKSVLVATDVEDGPAAFEDAGRPELLLDLLGRLPRGLQSFFVPCLKRTFGVCVLCVFPESENRQLSSRLPGAGLRLTPSAGMKCTGGRENWV